MNSLVAAMILCFTTVQSIPPTQSHVIKNNYDANAFPVAIQTASQPHVKIQTLHQPTVIDKNTDSDFFAFLKEVVLGEHSLDKSAQFSETRVEEVDSKNQATTNSDHIYSFGHLARKAMLQKRPNSKRFEQLLKAIYKESPWDNGYITCPVNSCGLNIKPDDFEDHLGDHLNELRYSCSMPSCKQLFSNLNGLKRHLVGHKITKLSKNVDLDKLMEQYGGSSKDTVSENSKILFIASTIIRNEKNSGLKTVKCPIQTCQKEIPKRQLKRHLQGHFGGAFECHVCNARLETNAKLKKHALRHINDDSKEQLYQELERRFLSLS